jgi:hypothetical protein
MTIRSFDTGAIIRLQLPIPAFRTADEAHALDWNHRFTLPSGTYVVRRSGRSEAELAGEACSDGYYYELEGPASGWVRRNYLLAGQHIDWPWDLTYCLEPIDWSKAWDQYRARKEEEIDQREGVHAHSIDVGESQGINGCGGVDEFGVQVARLDGWLPDFDEVFEIEE